MYPSVKNGDVLLVSRTNFPKRIAFINVLIQSENFSLSKNDIVIFEDDKSETLVKRVVGLPFDFYRFENGKVIISSSEFPKNQNQKTVIVNDFSFIKNSEFLPLLESGRIPENYYLLIGDNSEYSTDSRTFGLVPQSYLKGKVLWIF